MKRWYIVGAVCVAAIAFAMGRGSLGSHGTRSTSASESAEPSMSVEDETEKKQLEEEAKAAIDDCEGKTAFEAKRIAEDAGYKVKFEDSHGEDVTHDVHDGSDAGSAKVTKVEKKEHSLTGGGSVVFTIDYDDMIAATKDTIDTIKETKELLDDMKELTVGFSEGESAAGAIKTAKDEGYRIELVGPNGEKSSRWIKNEAYQSALKKATVAEATVNGKKALLKLNRVPAISAEDNQDLKEVLEVQDGSDKRVEEFAKKYDKDLIEFDACLSDVDKGLVRYDCLLRAGNDPDNASGPLFKFDGVSKKQLKWSDGEKRAPEIGMKVHVIAEIDRYKSGEGILLLKPVSLSVV